MTNKTKDFTFLDLLELIVKKSRVFIITFFLTAIISVGISLLLPKWYLAMTTILPPQQDITGLGLSSLALNVPLGGFGMFGESEEALLCIAILNSRSVMEVVAKKFDLMSVYKTKNMERTLESLAFKTDVEVQKEGTISIGVLDSDPQRSADMANFFVVTLDSVNSNLQVEKARNDRLFIGRRLEQNKADMKAAEEALNRFQKENGAIALPEQTEGLVTAAAELQARIVLTEVELRVKEKALSANHYKIHESKNELTELNKKLDEMMYGFKKNKESQTLKNELKSVFPPLADIPDLGMEYLRLYREVQVQNKIYELLVEQHERAKIKEARDTPTIQILDPAIKPERKAKPKRALIVLASVLLSMAIVLSILIVDERIKRLEYSDPDRYEKAQAVTTGLKRGLLFWQKQGR